MAPLYFFYNLPPSESKDILQDMLDPDASRKCEEKQKDIPVSNQDDSGCGIGSQTYDRCVIQWSEIKKWTVILSPNVKYVCRYKPLTVIISYYFA